MYDPFSGDSDELIDRLGEVVFGQIKAELDPTEYLLWADRPVLPRAMRIPAMPAFFVSVLAGLSGFSLAALFGLVEQGWIDLRTLLLALGLAPCVLGGMIISQLISLAVRRWLRCRRLARLVYAVTDHRAIVARIESFPPGMEYASLHPGDVVDTRRFENPDGSGDLFFLGQGKDHWLPIGFFEVPDVGQVELLARETLLNREQEWWKFGTSGAY
jgi:hypothetical protein